PSFWYKDPPPSEPRVGPVAHPAIRPGHEFNTVLLRVRKRQVEILVNSVPVCGPVWFDRDLVPFRLDLGRRLHGPGSLRAEFDRIEVRELLPRAPADRPGE